MPGLRVVVYYVNDISRGPETRTVVTEKSDRFTIAWGTATDVCRVSGPRGERGFVTGISDGKSFASLVITARTGLGAAGTRLRCEDEVVGGTSGGWWNSLCTVHASRASYSRGERMTSYKTRDVNNM